MSADKTLHEAVLAALAFDARIDASQIIVLADDGSITLTGHVSDHCQKGAAGDAASGVKGVKAVADEIEVWLRPDSRRSDTELREVVIQRLAWDLMAPGNAVNVKVEKGWVTLSGEVNLHHQKAKAKAEVRRMRGVFGILDQITVRPALAIAVLVWSCAGPAFDAPPLAGPAPVRPEDAKAIVATLRTATDQGFWASDFPTDPVSSAIAYARAQHGGRIPLAAFPSDWAIRPAPYNATTAFAAAVAEGRLATWLAGLPPPDPRYARLVQAYGRYRRIAERGGWPILPRSRGPKAGDSGPAVDALRARLAVEDQDVGAGPTYDASLAASVAKAQARYGLTADGRAGPATVAALNVPVNARLAQIAANLERWRWMPRTPPPFRLELNIADASLELFDSHGPSFGMRAIVGRSDMPTPMFIGVIRAVVLNPPWNVPMKIAVKEVWPKIRRDPGYAAREGFVALPGGGLRQLPGPKCALGVVKFDVTNPFGVYLHDTPARSLFALDRRALSHGCMRLERPVDLAKRLLAGDPLWPEVNIDMALLGGKTVRAPLRTPAPVFVAYWTAFVDGRDQIRFRPDVYHWDAKLLERLSPQRHRSP